MENKDRYGEYIDLHDGLKRVRGNRTLYRRMLGLFVDSKEFSALDEAIESGELTKAAEAAHGIKGVSGNLSMPLLFKVSTELMTELKSGNADNALLAKYYEIRERTVELVEQLMGEIDSEPD